MHSKAPRRALAAGLSVAVLPMVLWVALSGPASKSEAVAPPERDEVASPEPVARVAPQRAARRHAQAQHAEPAPLDGLRHATENDDVTFDELPVEHAFPTDTVEGKVLNDL